MTNEYRIIEEKTSYNQKFMLIPERWELVKDISQMIIKEDWNLKIPLSLDGL